MLDIILLIVGTLAFIRGWGKGLLWAICSVLGVILSVIIAMKLASRLADYLFSHEWLHGQYTLLIAFIILFFVCIGILRLSIRLVEKALDKVLLGWLNKVLGGVLYLFFVVFLCSTFYWLADQVKLIKPATKKDSMTYAYIAPIAPATIEFISPLLPYCKDVISDVKHQLDRLDG